MDNRKHINIVIPVYNEEAVIKVMVDRLESIANSLVDYFFKVIFVDDGSIDKTSEILKQTAIRGTSTRIIELSRNFGHQAAIAAGIDRADGDAVIIMDADLQDPPEMIASLLQGFEEGNDVVYTVKRSREGSSLKCQCYALFYALIDRLSETAIHRESGDFCLLSRRAINAMRSLPEYHRFHRGLRSWIGFKQKCLYFDRPERTAGQSKYSFHKLLRLALDGILSFSLVPLRAMSLVGISSIFLCACFALYSLWAYFTADISPTGFTALICFVLFTAGVQMTFLGIIGEYIGRIYEETKRRPLYIVCSDVSRDSCK